MNEESHVGQKGVVWVLLFAVFCMATAVIFSKLSTLPPAWFTAIRLMLAAVVQLPFFHAAWKRHRDSVTIQELFRWALLPGIFFGLHLVIWVFGLRLTLVSNASLIVNMVPVVLPFLLWVFVKERVSRPEIMATMIALSGLLILMIASFSFDSKYAVGNAGCLLAMVLMAAYIAIGRVNGKRIPSIWLYVVPLYLWAALVAIAVAPFGDPIRVGNWGLEILWIVLVVVVSTVMGHSLFNYSLKHVRGQVAGVVNLCQIIFASILGYFVFGELPGWVWYPAAALVVGGVAMMVVARRKTEPPATGQRED